MARALGWRLDEVRGVMDAMEDAASLNESAGPTPDASELRDSVWNEPAPDMAGSVVREVETTKLLDTVKKLPERSRYVLARRYGPRRLKQANLDETSEDLAISSNTVLRIQSTAEHVLRTRLCG